MRSFLKIAFIMVLACCPVRAEDVTDPKIGTGLPLPRYASLRSGEVNLRKGPGVRYPIDWVFRRRGMPVQITEEYENWRRIRDADGDDGWVHKNMLTGRRAAIVRGKKDAVHLLRADADESSSVIAKLQPGAVGDLMTCAAQWCRLRFDSVKGWLPKTEIWGVEAEEKFE